MLKFSFYLTITSIIVHLSTYIGIYFLNEYYFVFKVSYVIHFLIFIPFFAMFFRSFGKNKMENVKSWEGFSLALAFKKFFPNTEPKIGIYLLFIFIYVGINFFLSTNKLQDGSPEILDGDYVLNNKGEITLLEKKQYVQMLYYQLKAFSGHWVIFSIIPLVYFRDREKAKQIQNNCVVLDNNINQ